MRQSERKLAQREQLLPLIREVNQRLRRRGYSIAELSTYTGLPEYQIQRILSTAIAAPTWPELSALVAAAGMQPNEAARLVGLYGDLDPRDEPLTLLETLEPHERQILALLRDPSLSDADREDIVRTFMTFLALEKEARVKRFHPVTSTSRPLEKSDRVRKTREQAVR